MARTRQYSLDEIYEQAIPLILQKGYRGCSMDTLINYTGFNRRAFYLEFGNKQKFISKLLEYYLANYLEPLRQTMLENEQYVDSIVNFFQQYQTHLDKKGCLLVRLIIEMGVDDSSVQNLARLYYDQLQQSFIAQLEKAHKSKQFDNEVEIESLALKLACFAQGFAVSNAIKQGNKDALLVIKALFHQS